MKNVDFMKFKNLALIVSFIAMITALAVTVIKGFDYGIDFRGGVTTELVFKDDMKADKVQSILDDSFSEITVFNFGSAKNVVVQTPTEGDYKNASGLIIEKMKDSNINDVKVARSEIVGPKVGDELRTNGIIALTVVILAVLLYTSIRFEFKFALGAIFALIHDLLITIGLISLVGIDMDLTVLAALLAILGYSLNDTIIVFDRIRENFQKLSDKNVYDIINISINETLSRTIMTSLTTAVTLLAILIFSGETLKSFSIVLLFGIGIGTYSSIYVASSFLSLLKVNKEQFKKEKIDTENGVI
jgi:preprotein translocase subunit SecF